MHLDAKVLIRDHVRTPRQGKLNGPHEHACSSSLHGAIRARLSPLTKPVSWRYRRFSSWVEYGLPLNSERQIHRANKTNSTIGILTVVSQKISLRKTPPRCSPGYITGQLDKTDTVLVVDRVKYSLFFPRHAATS